MLPPDVVWEAPRTLKEATRNVVGSAEATRSVRLRRRLPSLPTFAGWRVAAWSTFWTPGAGCACFVDADGSAPCVTWPMSWAASRAASEGSSCGWKIASSATTTPSSPTTATVAIAAPFRSSRP